MLKKMSLMMVILAANVSWSQNCAEPSFPDATKYDQKTLAFMTTILRVKDRSNKEQVAEIKRRRFNLPKTLIQEGYIAGARFDYSVYNGNHSFFNFKEYDDLSFYGEQVFKKLNDAILNRIEVKDCNDQVIGYIVETIKYKASQAGAEILELILEVLTSDENGNGGVKINLSNMYSEFEILDAQGNVLGKSSSVKILNDNFEIKTDDEVVFDMQMRGWDLDPGADWLIDFSKNTSNIDNRILALIPAFKTYNDALENFADSF